MARAGELMGKIGAVESVVKKKCKAESCAFIFGGCVPASICAS